jgi:hypothetical protein
LKSYQEAAELLVITKGSGDTAKTITLSLWFPQIRSTIERQKRPIIIRQTCFSAVTKSVNTQYNIAAAAAAATASS